MVLTDEHRSAVTITCPNGTSPTTNLIWTDLLSNPDLRFERAAAKPLRPGTSFRIEFSSNDI